MMVRIPLSKINKTPPSIPQKIFLMVKFPLSKLNKTPMKETKTLAMLKANLAEQKARIAQQRGPIGASRTDDTALPSLSSPVGSILGNSLPAFSDTVIAPKSSSSSTVFEAATPFAPTHTTTVKPPPVTTVYSSGEQFDTPVRRKGPNIKYTRLKTPIVVATPKRKGPNIKYTKRKSPHKKKIP